jgi:hypothetical protein
MFESALQIRSQLGQLQAERALAVREGLGDNAAYMADLEEELAYRTQEYVVAAVTEIATLRAELDGPGYG